MAGAEATSTTTSRLPDGKYKVVSLALDLTGKKYIDEICSIGAFASPDKVFSHCVMPDRDISISATRKHGLKVFTQFGRYRIIRDTFFGKTMKTKSIYSSLLDFLKWLEGTKGAGNDGIILAFHDASGRDGLTPYLLTALQKYKLMDQFTEIVKGFCNICNVAAAQEELKGKSLTFRNLGRRLSEEKSKTDRDHGESIRGSKRRSQLTYQLLAKLLKAEDEVKADDLLTFCDNLQDAMHNLLKQSELAEKVRTLRPIFVSHIRKGPRDRQRAVALRRYLIEIHTDYAALESAYKSGGSEEIVKIVEKTTAHRRKKDADDLVKYIVQYFSDDQDAKAKDNLKKEIGQGEPGPGTVDHHEDSETEDDEFEEAKEDGDSDTAEK